MGRFSRATSRIAGTRSIYWPRRRRYDSGTGFKTRGPFIQPKRDADSRTYAVVIVDESGCILGLVTQTDVLMAMSRSLGFLESLEFCTQKQVNHPVP